MRSKFQFAVLFVLSAFLFSSCSAPETEATTLDMDKAKAQIQAMEDAFAAAEKAKDADGVVAYYTDDAISYGRNKEPLSGKEAIKKQIADDLATDTAGSTNVYKVVDLFGEGNTLVEIGSWTRINAAGAEVDKGHFMSYFKKQADGNYKCVRDMNVTSTEIKKPI